MAQLFAAFSALFVSFKSHPLTTAAGFAGAVLVELAHDPALGGAAPGGKAWATRALAAVIAVLGTVSSDGTKAAQAPAPVAAK